MKYKTIVRSSAIYDLLLTTPFMFPVVALYLFGVFGGIGEAVGLTRVTADISPDALLWISLMASVVTTWSIIRIIYPERRFGLFDGVTRFVFSFWFVFYPVVYNTTELSYLLLAPELAWGVIQLWGYWKIS